MNQHRCLSASSEMRCTSSRPSRRPRSADSPWVYGRNSAGWSAGSRDPRQSCSPWPSVAAKLTCARMRQPEEARRRSRRNARFKRHVWATEGESDAEGSAGRVALTLRQYRHVLALHRSCKPKIQRPEEVNFFARWRRDATRARRRLFTGSPASINKVEQPYRETLWPNRTERPEASAPRHE